MDDIHKLCNTVRYVIYDKDYDSFSDDVDGTRDRSIPDRGNFVGDGWVKLSRYDEEVNGIFKKFSENRKILRKYNQKLQFDANLLNFGEY